MSDGLERFLTACRSAPHRAVIGLLAVSEGVSAPQGLAADLAASDPQELAAIALVNHVHVAIGRAFQRQPSLADHVPRDFRVYLNEMAQANAERNAILRDQLTQIGQALSAAKIPALALKGSAELLSPAWPDPSMRFLSDIDILVPVDQVCFAREVLLGLGGSSPEHLPAFKFPDYHLPPITLPNSIALVELHMRVGDGIETELLPAEKLLESAIPTEAGLAVPDPVSRLVHLIAHGQIHHNRHDEKQLYLRDCLEFHLFSRSFGEKFINETRQRFESVGLRDIFFCFRALSNAIFGQSFENSDLRSEKHMMATLKAFGRPRRKRFWDIMSWILGISWRIFGSAEHRRYYLAVLSDHRRLRQVLREAARRGNLTR